jgi:hypothetical protein
MTRKSKKAAAMWTESLDREAVHEALEEACVDAYGQDEEHSGLLAVIQVELEFPFNALVIGETVQVVGMDYPEDDSLGLDLVIERNGKRYPIDARSVDLVPPFPDGHLYLAAYLAWKRNQ